jgi:hypothetical protein
MAEPLLKIIFRELTAKIIFPHAKCSQKNCHGIEIKFSKWFLMAEPLLKIISRMLSHGPKIFPHAESLAKKFYRVLSVGIKTSQKSRIFAMDDCLLKMISRYLSVR